MTLSERARKLIQDTQEAPRMYALSREAYIMRITTILEMVVELDVASFYSKVRGWPSPAEWTKDLDQEWADMVAEAALKLIPV